MRVFITFAFITLLASGATAQSVPGFGGLDTEGFVSGASWAGEPPAPEVITTIVSTRLTYPNATIPGYTYDVENLADDGSSIRYAYVKPESPDTPNTGDYYQFCRGSSYERGNSSNLGWQSFVWFSLNGVNAGDKIEFAQVRISRSMWQNSNLDSDAYFVARVDTVLSDYSCLDYASTTADPCLLDITYNNKNATGSSDPWSPALVDRKDWYQFGPRSLPIAGDDFGQAQGDTIVLDVTDAIQQIADRGQDAVDLGALIIFGSVRQSNDNWGFAAGSNGSYLPSSGGNPALVMRTSSYRGNKIWGSGKVPVVLTYDDEHHEDVGIFEALGSGSPDFDWVCYHTPWTTWCDSLYTAQSDNINFIHHGYIHDQLGSLSSADLNTALDKSTWLMDIDTPPDTTSMAMQFAWPGGSGSPFYSMEALWKMQAYGYAAGRGTGLGSTSEWSNDTPIGRSNFLSWDGYTNLYTVTAVNIGAVLLDGVPIEDEATIRKNLMEQVDWMYTEGGRGAATFYGHTNTNGITISNTTALAGIIDDSWFLERRSFGDVVTTMRARGFVDAADVVAETGTLKAASVADSLLVRYPYLSAVRQDSTATAEGGSIADAFDSMWVGPASN